MTPGTDREEIVRRFEALLDAALAGENPPAGIDAEILESVLNGSADRGGQRPGQCPRLRFVCALGGDDCADAGNQTARQGVSGTEPHAGPAQTEKIADELRAVYAERERALRRETERRCRRDVLGALIDLRDRLGRGRESARVREEEIAAADRAGWLPRMLGQDLFASIGHARPPPQWAR